jgi:hypothetical protein
VPDVPRRRAALIAITAVGAGDEAAIEAYLLARDDTLAYASPRYRALLCQLLDAREETLVARRGGAVCGVLPALSRGGVVNSLPYYGSNGGVIADDGEAAAALADAWDALATAPTTRAATIVTNPFARRPHPAVRHTMTDSRIAQFTRLDGADPLELAEPSARRNVRKGEASGYRVSRNAGEFPRLHEIHHANITAIGGRPKTPRFFELVPKLLEEGRDYDLWVARRDGRVDAALLVLLFNRTVEYYTPAINHDARPLQPAALVLAEAMRHYSERGFAIWNWGGTWHTQESLHRFKRKWGAEEREYPYYVQVNDESLLERNPDEILRDFDGFYVAPFSALRATKGAG